MSADIVELLIRDRIAVITLNRPQQRNALSIEMRPCLHGVSTRSMNTSRVIVLQGAGAAFCAGADLGDMAGYAHGFWRDRIVTAQDPASADHQH